MVKNVEEHQGGFMNTVMIMKLTYILNFQQKQTKCIKNSIRNNAKKKKEPIVILITVRHSLLKSASKSSKHGFHDDVSMDNFFLLLMLFSVQ